MVKAAPKPAGNTSNKSVFAAMKDIGRLNKNFSKAKTVQAVREYDGPDGDLICKLARVNHGTKDGALYILLEFHVLEGEYTNSKLVLYYGFKDDEYRTLEEVQNDFFVALQLMGVDTASGDDNAMNAQLDTLRKEQTPLTLRVKRKENKAKKTTYTNVSMIGVASAAQEIEDTEYVEEGTEALEEAPEDIPDAQDIAEMEALETQMQAAEEEWSEVEEEPQAEEEPVTEEFPPSSWVEYEVKYKGMVWVVLEADDETRKVKIKNKQGKVYNVQFDQLELPVAE